VQYHNNVTDDDRITIMPMIDQVFTNKKFLFVLFHVNKSFLVVQNLKIAESSVFIFSKLFD